MALMLKGMGIDFDAIQKMAEDFVRVTREADARLTRMEASLARIERTLGTDESTPRLSCNQDFAQ
jgi:hypothetical protein